MEDKDNLLMEIVVGTYEKYLLGYKLEMNSDKFSLKPSFSTEAHIQSVKCVASSSKYLASGSGDETIQLFNMKTRHEIGTLIHHNGTITSLEFYENFLVSSSEDKTICIWSASNWQCLKTLSGHKASVSCVSIHPTGKMAISVSKDKHLRTWNLINGRSAYSTNINKVADSVSWSPDGTCFLITSGNTIDVYELENASIKSTIDFQQKISDATFVKEDVIAVGGENECIKLYDLKTGIKISEIKANATRVKALNCATASEEKFLISASSEGDITVWHLDVSQEEVKSRKIVKVNTGSRLTCMTVLLKS